MESLTLFSTPAEQGSRPTHRLNPEVPMRVQAKILTAAVLVALAACGGDAADEAPVSEDVGAPITVPELSNGELLGLSRDQLTMTLPWGNGQIARDPEESAAAPMLMSLDVVGSTGFDRMVFEFSDDAPFPGYQVGWATEAIEGCSENVGTEDNAILRVSFDPVSLTDENGRQIVSRTTNAGLDLLSTATRVCEMDQRAVFELQASSATQFRVLHMRQPNRLVVDMRAGGE